jgi:hypothetical protein
MAEDESPKEHPEDARVDDLYRVFLSRYDEGKGQGKASSSSHRRASDFLPLLFEEIDAVGQTLETLDGELGQTLVSVKHHEQQQADRLRGELTRARTRLRQISRSLATRPQDPKEWNLAEMFAECVRLLEGEMRGAHLRVSLNCSQDIPPVVFHHPRPEQAIFAMLQGMVESEEISGARITIQISRVGERTFAEVFVHHGERALDRKRIPLASLLPLSVTDGVHLDWEATPGRFVLRMEFPSTTKESEEPAKQHTTEESTPATQGED